MDSKDAEKTRLMGDADAAQDAGATRLMDDAGATRLMGDEDKTVAADAAPTSLIGSAPTTRIPAGTTMVSPSVPAGVPMPDLEVAEPNDSDDDGIDVLDDPYRSPIDLADLTEARQPVQVESPVTSLPERKKRLPVWAIVLIVLVLIGAAGGSAWYTYDREMWGGRTVPLVIGLDADAAKQQLEAAGFQVTIEEQLADDDIGTVVACDPQPGVRADTSGGATIKIATARTIPDIVGKTTDEAEAALRELGATNITIQPVASSAASGTVVEVEPGAGSEFAADDRIVVSVATPYVVPQVVGMTFDDAKYAIEKAGLTSKVDYVASSEAGNTVISSDPVAGKQIEENGVVTLQVSSPYPTEPTHLLEYFDATSNEVATYLGNEKFELLYGATMTNGDAHAVYQGTSGELLTFGSQPEFGSYGDGATDVLSAGAPISGVRLAFSSADMPSKSVSTDGIRAVMSACGFDGLDDTCTESDLASLGLDVANREFIAGYGTQGNHAWAVLIGGDKGGEVNVIALACPKEHLASEVDLADFGGSPVKYIAAATFCPDAFKTQTK